MPDILIRPCTRQDIESILQLDKRWEEEDVSYVFFHIPPEDLIADLERLLAVAAQNGITRFIVSTVTKDMTRILNFYRRHGPHPHPR